LEIGQVVERIRVGEMEISRRTLEIILSSKDSIGPRIWALPILNRDGINLPMDGKN
jgi:hypothetical protein